jgi:hypothetical protein
MSGREKPYGFAEGCASKRQARSVDRDDLLARAEILLQSCERELPFAYRRSRVVVRWNYHSRRAR